MSRQSISFTEPNSEWLRTKVDTEGEYKSKSELVNALIRQERARERAELAVIQLSLDEGEKSGISERTPDEIMQAVLDRKVAK